jgi:hypothetical protein
VQKRPVTTAPPERAPTASSPDADTQRIGRSPAVSGASNGSSRDRGASSRTTTDRPIYQRPPNRGRWQPPIPRRLAILVGGACALTIVGAVLGQGVVRPSPGTESDEAVVDSGGNRSSIISALRSLTGIGDRQNVTRQGGTGIALDEATSSVATLTAPDVTPATPGGSESDVGTTIVGSDEPTAEPASATPVGATDSGDVSTPAVTLATAESLTQEPLAPATVPPATAAPAPVLAAPTAPPTVILAPTVVPAPTAPPSTPVPATAPPTLPPPPTAVPPTVPLPTVQPTTVPPTPPPPTAQPTAAPTSPPPPTSPPATAPPTAPPKPARQPSPATSQPAP